MIYLLKLIWFDAIDTYSNWKWHWFWNRFLAYLIEHDRVTSTKLWNKFLGYILSLSFFYLKGHRMTCQGINILHSKPPNTSIVGKHTSGNLVQFMVIHEATFHKFLGQSCLFGWRRILHHLYLRLVGILVIKVKCESGCENDKL